MQHILRSMIFVPGFRSAFLEKARTFDADALIFDLEDSVPVVFKDEARKNIAEFLGTVEYSQKIFIRLNSIDSGYLSRDLDYVLDPRVFGFMPAMVRDELDIVYIDKLLTQLEHDKGFVHGHFKLCPLIETGSALLKAYEIAKASPRMVGLAFGAEDYLTDLDGLHKESGASILVARSMIVMAARSLNMAAIDTPFLDISNLEAFRREVELARELGFSGQLILHPNQIEIANQVFTPSEEEVAEARRIIDAIEASGKEGQGVTLLDGRLVGPPMEKRARKVVEKWDRIKSAR
jgi:citrate lyase subunit beta/citryl-CoA lyase